MKKFTLWIILILLFSSCAMKPVQIEQYENFDKTDKSISFPPGGDGPLAAIKKAFKKEGWDLHIRGNSLITKNINNNQETSIKYVSRYSLLINYWKDRGAIIRYDASIIDNKTGKEVVTFNKLTAYEFQTMLDEDIANDIINWVKKH